MARTGRPPLTEAVIRERIADYCSRYDAALTETGFPVYPAGLRETRQHREWITLFKVFSRFKERSLLPKASRGDKATSACPICLQALTKPGKPHPRCGDVVEFVRGLGTLGLDRIRAAAFPDEAAAPSRPAEPVSKRKV